MTAGCCFPPQGNVATGAASTFLELTDTPSSYTANRLLRVNAGGTALEFVDADPTDHWQLGAQAVGSEQSFGSTDAFDVPLLRGNAEVARLGAAQFLVKDGAVGAPGIAFVDDPDSGFYRLGANDTGWVVNGGLVVRVEAAPGDGFGSLVTLPRVLGTNVGSSTNPTIGFKNGADLRGWYFPALDGIAATETVLLQDGSAAAPGLAFADDPDSGLYRLGSNDLGIAINGGQALRLESIAGLVVCAVNRLGTNAAFGATPVLGHLNDPDTGLAFPAVDQFAIRAGGVEVMRCEESGSASLWSIHGATAVVQPSAVTKPSGGATVDAEARTAIDSLIDLLSAAAGGNGITA